MNRYVTFPMRLRALFSSLHAKLALPFLLINLVVIGVLAVMVDWNSLKFSKNAVVRKTGGTLLGIKPTSVSVNRVRVMAYRFRYRVEGEDGYRTGISYRTGYINTGKQKLTIEYLADKPEIARIEGMRTGIMSPLFLLILIPLVLVGLGCFITGWRRGRQVLAVLERGEFTRGRLLTELPTNTTINKRRVMACTFEYEVSGSTYTVTAKTRIPELIKDEPEERIVYNPDNPSQAVLFDLLPPKIRAFLDGGRI